MNTAPKAAEATRVLFGLRLFSGLADSLSTRRWEPKGVPAIYKLLEGATARPDLETLTVLAVKDRDLSDRFPTAARIELPEIGPVLILPYRHLPLSWLRRAEIALTEIEHAIRFLVLGVRYRPAASYFTAVNVPAAGLFARLHLGRVYLRLMGIMPEHRSLALGRGPLRRFFYRSPFDCVICTQEGSGSERILPQLLSPGVPFDVLLNGVDRQPKAAPVTSTDLRKRFGLDNRPIVLFLGRLVSYKGCLDFVEGMIELMDRGNRRAQAVLVGSGSEESAVRQRIAAAGRSEDIHVVGAVPHDVVSAFYAACEVYVSLNRHGNLSNANLEALSAGCCMVLLESDPETGIDEATDRVIPGDIAPRVSRTGTARALAETVEQLLDDPQRRSRLKRAAADLASRIVGSWDDRVARELAMITGSATSGTVTVAPTLQSQPSGKR